MFTVKPFPIQAKWPSQKEAGRQMTTDLGDAQPGVLDRTGTPTGRTEAEGKGSNRAPKNLLVPKEPERGRGHEKQGWAEESPAWLRPGAETY